MVDNGDFLDAADGAMGSAGLFREVLTIHIGERVFLERNTGITALLRAIVNQAILTDIEIAGTCTASPIVRFASREIFLEPIEAAVALLTVGFDFLIDAFLAAIQRFHGAAA